MNSMTGYGHKAIYRDGRELTLSMRSVNHRFLDPSIRLPRSLNMLEEPIRARLKDSFARGHFDISLTYRNMRDDALEVVYNHAALKAYQSAFGRMAEEGVRGDLDAVSIAALPGIFSLTEKEDDRETILAMLEEAMVAASAELAAARAQEGARLEQDICACLDELERTLCGVERATADIVSVYRERLRARLSDLLGDIAVDEQRIAQEVVLFADRAAIDEEIVRLKAHIAQARDAMTDAVCGKRLDFILQEMNREANTITSKAVDVGVLHDTVTLKTLIERLREQVQNVE